MRRPSRWVLPIVFAAAATWVGSASPSVPPPDELAGGLGTCSSALGCRVVGPGGGLCDFPTVQQAVAASAVEIRILAGTYGENVSIADRNLVITGGFASCANAASGIVDVGSRSTIAPGTGRAMLIQQASTGAMALTLRNLVLTGAVAADGGALRIVGNPALATRNVAVTLDHVTARDSAAFGARGGGIAVQDADLVLQISDVRTNVATRGGGLYCLRANVFLGAFPAMLGSDGSGAGNRAVLQGGGAWLDQGCSFDATGLVGNNVAGLDGGGVYIAAGGSLIVGPDSGNGVAMIVGNSANSADTAGGHGGGGIFASGSGANVDVTNAFFSYNTAGSLGGAADNSVGGAIAVVDGARLLVRRYSTPCWSARACVAFVSNEVQGRGAAIYASTEAPVRIADGLIYANSSRAPNGSVIELVSGGATRVVENSYIVQNTAAGQPGSSVIRLSGSNVLLRSNVMADNEYSSAAIELNFVNAEIRGVNVWQPGRLNYLNIGGGPEALVNCVFSDSWSTVWPVGAQATFAGDPIFRSPAHYDYRVHPYNGTRISGVVDRCLPVHLQSTLAADLAFDGIGQARNVDLATISNDLGPIDIGPSEEQSDVGDLIFRDSLEL